MEPAEVEQPQWDAVDMEPSRVCREFQIGEVPIGDVDAGIAEEVAIGDKGGGQVEPALIVMDAAGERFEAMGLETLFPPFEEAAGLGVAGDADDAAVVHPG